MDLGLHDKHAIVTGGSRGIGKAIARELAREGADVAIVARNKADLEATARELAAETNRRVVRLAADVTSKEQVDRMVAEAAQQLGGLHILVNSGSAPGGSATATGPIETVIDADLLQNFNVKYVGALRCSRAVIPFMKMEGWGRISPAPRLPGSPPPCTCSVLPPWRHMLLNGLNRRDPSPIVPSEWPEFGAKRSSNPVATDH